MGQDVLVILGNVRLPGGEPFDLSIADGVITAIGGLGEADVDLGGRWVVPGLWDEHVHTSQWAQHRQRLDLSGATSAIEAAQLVADAPRPPGDLPIVGGGYRDGLWPDRPGADLLDAAEERRPVVLISGDLHSCWLNTAALQRFGFPEHPTGLLVEDDCFRVVRELDDVPEDVLDDWVRDAGLAAAARGVVGITDLEMNWNLADWQRRMANGFDSLRVASGFYPPYLERAIREGYSTGMLLSDLLEIGPFKIITDGSLNTRTAYCCDPYPDGGFGMLTVPTEELVDWLRMAADGGFQAAVHAIGDEANRLALDAFAATGAPGRIEHAQLLREVDFARFAELGVAASVQPEQAMDDRDVAERYWAGRTPRSYAYRSLLDAGVTMVFGSDAPVAPLDPWITIAAAVTRSRDGRPAWHPEQTVPVEIALASSSRSSIAVGQPGDLAVLDEDPLTAPDLREMPVAATLLAGRFTFEAL
jgi:predicted amidohydrolase YtcJ